MLNIFRIHRDIGLYKYSLHPSSYFIIEGQLKNINYFFSYLEDHDASITIRSVLSHISTERQKTLFEKISQLGLEIDQPTDHSTLQILAFESFKNNFRNDIMEQAKEIYS
jgi:hypothetical protein